jgi:hypothetical protein
MSYTYSIQRCPQETQSSLRSSLTSRVRPGCKINAERESPWSTYVQQHASRVRPASTQSFQQPSSAGSILAQIKAKGI